MRERTEPLFQKFLAKSMTKLYEFFSPIPTEIIMKTRTLLSAMAVLGLSTTASAAISPVLLYDADGGTGAGTPGVLANGTAIVDQSGAGNNGVTTNGVSGSGTGEVSTVEDDPFNAVGELSFSYDGSSARVVTNSTGLLSQANIAANGGYTMHTWAKYDIANNSGIRSLMVFAGTDGINIGGTGNSNLNVIGQNGGTQFVGPDIGDNQWHEVELRVDTSGDGDGVANDLIGAGELFVDGVSVATGTVTITANFEDRTIGVGGHSQGFGTTEFTGLLYNPSVSLGVVPEPGSLALLGLGALAVLRRRK